MNNREKGSLNDARNQKPFCERWFQNNKSLGKKKEIITAKFVYNKFYSKWCLADTPYGKEWYSKFSKGKFRIHAKIVRMDCMLGH